jgi:hypothetical protein
MVDLAYYDWVVIAASAGGLIVGLFGLTLTVISASRR